MFYLSDFLKFFYSRFDPSGRGELTDKEMYNVLKIMNKIDISQEQAGPLTFDNFCYFVVFCRFPAGYSYPIWNFNITPFPICLDIFHQITLYSDL